MVHGKNVDTLHSAPATPQFPHDNTLRRYHPKKGIQEGVTLVAMAVMEEAVETVLIVVVVVVMIIMVVLGALTVFLFYPYRATHRLAPSIPAPPTTHKRPVPSFLCRPPLLRKLRAPYPNI